MKEKRSFKRFDLISALAVLGVLLVLLFEGFFIFEFYRVDYAKIEPYLPGILKEWFEPPSVPVAELPEPDLEETVPDEVSAESVQTNSTAAVEEAAAPATNAAPESQEEPRSDPADGEPVPVG